MAQEFPLLQQVCVGWYAGFTADIAVTKTETFKPTTTKINFAIFKTLFSTETCEQPSLAYHYESVNVAHISHI